MKIVGLPLLACGIGIARYGVRGFQGYTPGGNPDNGWASDSMPDAIWAAGCVLAGGIMTLGGGGMLLLSKA